MSALLDDGSAISARPGAEGSMRGRARDGEPGPLGIRKMGLSVEAILQRMRLWPAGGAACHAGIGKALPWDGRNSSAPPPENPGER